MSIGIDSVERLLEHRRVRAGGQRHVVAAVHNEIVDALTVSVERSAVQREDATVEPTRARPTVGPPLVPVLGARAPTRPDVQRFVGFVRWVKLTVRFFRERTGQVREKREYSLKTASSKKKREFKGDCKNNTNSDTRHTGEKVRTRDGTRKRKK